MKKTYQKPELYAESFLLQEHIAACSAYAQSVTYASHNDGRTCYFETNTDDFGQIKLFLNTDVAGCQIVMEGEAAPVVNLQCYYGPGDGMGAAFSSL